MPNPYEVARLACGFNPIVNDAQADTDTDSLANLSEIGMGTDPCQADMDADGCKDGAEAQTAVGSQLSGGRRHPLNPWDYFNLSHDGLNRIDDVLAVVSQYFVDQANSTTAHRHHNLLALRKASARERDGIEDSHPAREPTRCYKDKG